MRNLSERASGWGGGEYWMGSSSVRRTNRSRWCAWRVLIGLTVLLAPLHPAFGAEDPGQLTSSQRVHPVLIRNAHNPLLRLTCEIGARRLGLRVTSLTFSLDGTDDLGDVDALTLFATGNEEGFSTQRRLGEPQPPARSITFQTSYELRPGRHAFWLSCRLKPTANLTHKVDAECTSFVTTSGELSAKDSTPGVRKRIGVALRRHYDDGVHTYRIPALTTTKKGSLLAVYDMRRRKSRDLQEDIDIGLSRSVDGGQTWEAPRVIMDMGTWGKLPEEQNGCSDPGIVVDPATGEIFCFAVWMWGKPGKHQWVGDGSEPGFEIGKSAQFLMVRSSDDGLTWSPPENLTRKLKKPEWWLFAPSPSQGIALSDGTLVMPTEGRDATGRPFANIMYSSDHGVSWTVSAPAFSDGNECQAVELKDGSLMLNMRTDTKSGYRGVYVTANCGATWKPHATHLNTLIEPGCNGSLYRFDYEEGGSAKSVLLFANPQAKDGRHHHTIQVSFDEGKTWPEKYRLLLDVGRGRGYPSITRVDEQHVGLVYEGSRADVVFEKFSLGELLRW